MSIAPAIADSVPKMAGVETRHIQFYKREGGWRMQISRLPHLLSVYESTTSLTSLKERKDLPADFLGFLAAVVRMHNRLGGR